MPYTKRNMVLQAVQKRLSLDSVYDIPCFTCLSRKAVKEIDCKPEKCNMLEFWIRRIR